MCQGDPLSHFLFLLVNEGLNGLMQNAMQLDMFQPFKVSNDIRFNLLQFTHDTIIVGEGTWNNLRTIKATLRGFELASRLCVNFNKRVIGLNLKHGFGGYLNFFGLWC